MKNRILTVAALTAISLTVFSQAQTAPSFGSADIVGSWASKGCEKFDMGGQDGFIKRQFVFTLNTWDLQYTIFADPVCNVGLLTSRISGAFILTGAAALPNTNHVIWGQTAKAITPLAPPILETMNKTGCGDSKLPLGSPRDISISGCLALGTPNVRDYGQEYDLLKLEKGQLFTGLRKDSMNLPANRPTQIFEYPLEKVK